MINELLNNLEAFCAGELERRREGFVESEVASASQAVANIAALRRRIAEKNIPPDDFWQAGGDLSPEALALYAAERPGKTLPPKDGEPYILLSGPGAIFVAIERGPSSLQCYFRNESAFQGPFWDSVLIREATDQVWSIWPEKCVYTIVRTTGRAKHPGLNFRMAGWGVFSAPRRGFCKIGAYIHWFEGRQ